MIAPLSTPERENHRGDPETILISPTGFIQGKRSLPPLGPLKFHPGPLQGKFIDSILLNIFERLPTKSDRRLEIREKVRENPGIALALLISLWREERFFPGKKSIKSARCMGSFGRIQGKMVLLWN